MITNNVNLLLYSIFLPFLTLNTSPSKPFIFPCFYDQTADEYQDYKSNHSSSNETTGSDSDYYSCNEYNDEPRFSSRQRSTPFPSNVPIQNHMNTPKKTPSISCCAKYTACCCQYGIQTAIGGLAGYCIYCYPEHTIKYTVAPLAQCCNVELVSIGICATCLSGLCCPKKCDSCLKKGCCCLLLAGCSYAYSPYR